MNTEDLGWLAKRLDEVDGHAGTVHRIRDDLLCLTGAQNIPSVVRATVDTVPRGKGMAGQAWARNEPVFVCDLQSSDHPDVRPGARKVNASAAVALPVHDGRGRVRAVVGFAFEGIREFGSTELRNLEALAETLPTDDGLQVFVGASV